MATTEPHADTRPLLHHSTGRDRYLAPEGTPFAELALPPGSAGKPYFQYVVDDPTRLPPGWHIEQSEVAPWFHQPGGGQQYRIINEEGATGDVAELVRWGYLRRIN